MSEAVATIVTVTADVKVALALDPYLINFGRFKKGEQIDHRTGFILQAKVGDYRQAGEPLVEIHARSESEAVSVRESLLACYSWSDAPVTPGPLIHGTIRP